MPNHREHDLPGDRWCFKSRRASTFDTSLDRKNLLAKCHQMDILDALTGSIDAEQIFADDSIQEIIDSQKIMSRLYHQQLAIRNSDTVWTSNSDPMPIESYGYYIDTRFRPEPDRWINLDPPRIRVADNLSPVSKPRRPLTDIDYQKFWDSLAQDLSDY